MAPLIFSHLEYKELLLKSFFISLSKSNDSFSNYVSIEVLLKNRNTIFIFCKLLIVRKYKIINLL